VSRPRATRARATVPSAATTISTSTFPNADPWSFQGTFDPDKREIAGFTRSAQGGVALSFEPAD
jgi:hypothetical protein